MLNAKEKCPLEINDLLEYIQNLASSFSKAFFHSLPRQCNNVAHMMAAYAMENKDSSIWLGSYYEYIHLHCF